jgi:hypothetical protein
MESVSKPVSAIRKAQLQSLDTAQDRPIFNAAFQSSKFAKELVCLYYRTRTCTHSPIKDFQVIPVR